MSNLLSDAHSETSEIKPDSSFSMWFYSWWSYCLTSIEPFIPSYVRALVLFLFEYCIEYPIRALYFSVAFPLQITYEYCLAWPLTLLGLNPSFYAPLIITSTLFWFSLAFYIKFKNFNVDREVDSIRREYEPSLWEKSAKNVSKLFFVRPFVSLFKYRKTQPKDKKNRRPSFPTSEIDYKRPRSHTFHSGNVSTLHSNRIIRKRDKIINMAKGILMQNKQEPNQPLLRKRTLPPLEVFDEEEDDMVTHGLPSDVLYILKTCRVFGHFEEPVFLELCKYVETIPLETGESLFKIGDPDDSIYVVSKGSIMVSINDGVNPITPMCPIGVGESVESLLSILDVISGSESKFKSVEAAALEPALVIRLPIAKATPIFDKFPHALRQLMRTNIVRLHRVTLLILYKYFGITKDLYVNPNVGQYTLSSKSKEEPHHLPEKISNVKSHGSLQNLSADTINESAFSTQKAAEKLGEVFNITDIDFLKTIFTVEKICPQTRLIKHGQPVSKCFMCLILKGSLSLFVPNKENKMVFLYTVHAGSIAGHLSLITTDHSLAAIETGNSNTVIAKITNKNFEILLTKFPDIIFPLAHEIVSCCSPLVRRYDFGIKWMAVNAGQSIYKQDQKCDAVYIVLNGRLRSVIERAGNDLEFLDEYGRGESVGELELLTDSKRIASVHAVRDSEIAKIHQQVFESLQNRYPDIAHEFSKRLSMKFLDTLKHSSSVVSNRDKSTSTTLHKNLSTIAVVAISSDIPLSHFCSRLTSALSHTGSALHLTQSLVIENLGTKAFSLAMEYRLISWLGQQEEHHRFVIYEADKNVTSWTKRCLRQADCILFVGFGRAQPNLGQVEKFIESNPNRAQKELVLLHNFEARPRGTVTWLNLRPWCTSHHHVRARKAMLKGTAKFHTDNMPSGKNDFARLARRLTNTSVGLVLGGGGARGISQIGVIRALEEQGIPIDMVGGTSIGSCLGALYAEETHVEPLSKRARVWSFLMSSHWQKLLDLTYPGTAMFSGASMNEGLQDLFGDMQLEDLWIPYFCITTDLTDSKMKIHKDGHGWKYIRGSMTLTGYLPPLCDPSDGHLLVDGGYTNIMPADVMKECFGAQTVIAVDVSADTVNDMYNYGDHLSGWWVLWNKWNPFSETVVIPNMQDIQDRLAYVSCVRQMEHILKQEYCQYLKPPVNMFSTLQFGSYDVIQEIGYTYGKAKIAEWKTQEKMQHLFSFKEKMVPEDEDELDYPESPIVRKRSSDSGRIQSGVSQIVRTYTFDLKRESLIFNEK